MQRNSANNFGVVGQSGTSVGAFPPAGATACRVARVPVSTALLALIGEVESAAVALTQL
jgi:hypothetical protein